MATGHACAKVFAKLKATIPSPSAPCFEAAGRLENALDKASLAQTMQGNCQLCPVVPEIDRIAELVVNLEEEMHSLYTRLFQWFSLALGIAYTPCSKTRRELERECRALILFLESTSSSDSRCPDVMTNQPTSIMFESSREFQISGASIASLSGSSSIVNYFPVIFNPRRESATEATRNNEYDELHTGSECLHCHQLERTSACDSLGRQDTTTPVLCDRATDKGLKKIPTVDLSF